MEFQCEDCEMKFNSAESSHIHWQTHYLGFPDTEIRDDILDEGKFKGNNLDNSGEKPFTCDTCGNRFVSKRNLNRHLSTHSGQKPYACNNCGKRFSQKSHLHVHIRIHTGERPYSCNVCEKRFSHKISLKRHSETHSVRKTFRCHICNKSFTNKYHLVIHSNIYFYGEPFCKE